KIRSGVEQVENVLSSEHMPLIHSASHLGQALGTSISQLFQDSDRVCEFFCGVRQAGGPLLEVGIDPEDPAPILNSRAVAPSEPLHQGWPGGKISDQGCR